MAVMRLHRIRKALLTLAAAAAVAGLLGACATARNYPDPAGPRFHGEFAGLPAVPTIKVVTLNVKYSRRIATVVQLLREVEALRNADVVALQEMDDAGTEAIARALSLNYVYYPGALHPKTGKNFGNALLTRWPIEAERKLVLPHPGKFRKMIRIAVAATIRIRDVPVRCYSLHLETPLAVNAGQRRDQAQAVIEDAEPFPRVVVAGDFNNAAIVAAAFQAAGYNWATRDVGPTISRFPWDHVFARGLRLRDFASAAVVAENRRVSDHHPVWVELVLE
jgi:endonuclease/exonuclease/phosphatase family metal-dependent hydrolase